MGMCRKALLALFLLPQIALSVPVTSCKASIHFDCKAGTKNRCIPAEWHCDNVPDCDDGLDEKGCSYLHQCSPGMMMCRDGACISKSFKCDKEVDCVGGNDEHGCEGYDLSHLRYDDEQDDGAPAFFEVTTDECKTPKYRCRSGYQCLNGDAVCDGVEDCPDGDDEVGCSKPSSNVFGSDSEPDFCPFAHSRCRDNSVCIPSYWVCDGQPDCDDASDEKNCDGEEDDHSVFVADVSEMCHKKCQHYCDVNGNHYSCSCASGYRLGKDQHSCHADYHDDGLIYLAIGSDIRSMPVYDAAHSTNAYKSVQRLQSHDIARGVDYNTRTKALYIGSCHGRHGSDCDLNVYVDQTLNVIRKNITGLENVAVDYISGSVYYTQQYPAEYPGISVCTADGSNCRRIVDGYSTHSTDLDKRQRYRGLALNPSTGSMVWIEGYNKKFKMMVANMDGTNVRVLLDNKLEDPRGLAFDTIKNEVYFGDIHAQVLEKVSVNTHERQVVLSRGVHHPYDVKYFDGHLYWTDWATETLKHVEISEHHATPQTLHSFNQQPMGMVFAHPSYQVSSVRNPCDGISCSGICVPVPAPFSASPIKSTCVCPEGSVYSTEVNNCVPRDASMGEKDSYVDSDNSRSGWTAFWFFFVVMVVMVIACLYLYENNASFNQMTRATYDKAQQYGKRTYDKVTATLTDSTPTPTVVTFNNPLHGEETTAPAISRSSAPSEEDSTPTNPPSAPVPAANPEFGYANKFVQ